MAKTNRKNSTLAEPELESQLLTDWREALMANPKALATWLNITSIARRDWISWIDSTKQPETRRRRIEKGCSMLASGKRRPCCFSVVPMDLYKSLGNNVKAKSQWQELTPIERRDLISWVGSAQQKEDRKQRIEKACAMLAAGKRSQK